MTPDQEYHYLKGLNAAKKAIQKEEELSVKEKIVLGDALLSHRYSCRICIGAIQRLIDVV